MKNKLFAGMGVCSIVFFLFLIINEVTHLGISHLIYLLKFTGFSFLFGLIFLIVIVFLIGFIVYLKRDVFEKFKKT
ncbi:hypothetical protein HOH87_05430 [bacterium]|jgi:hypothetical protein|nr:hypothetical protein [bacterium]